MQVTLLPNLPSFRSFSMERYHRELAAALRRQCGLDDSVVDFPFSRFKFLSTLPELKNWQKWMIRVDRWLLYPLAVKSFGQGHFHILDHSHAHLALATTSKVVVTCHDLISFKSLRGDIPISTSNFNDRMLKRLSLGLKRADRIIAISETTKKDLIELMEIPAEKIRVVLFGKNEAFKPINAQQLTNERAQMRDRLGLDQDANVILHVGTAVDYKNTPAIVKAMAELLKNDKKFWFLRVGAPLNPSESELANALGVTERICYAGPVYDDALLAQYYRTADVFVFPSFWEGFGWPPLEAMGCGTPVVCSKAPALKEVVGDAAITVEASDWSALAGAIESVLGSETLKTKLINAGLQRSAQFTWDRAGRETLQVYQELFLR